MAGITFKIQQTTREIERHIDRANGAPAVEAAMCCDDGTEEIFRDSYAFLIVMLSRHHPSSLQTSACGKGVERFLHDSAEFVSYCFAMCPGDQRKE